MQEYERFIHDICNFMQTNLNESPDLFFNIYFDQGKYWIKLEPTAYAPVHSGNNTQQIIDPMSSFSCHELQLETRRMRSAEEINRALKEFVKLEISQESFELWRELT